MNVVHEFPGTLAVQVSEGETTTRDGSPIRLRPGVYTGRRYRWEGREMLDAWVLGTCGGRDVELKVHVPVPSVVWPREEVNRAFLRGKARRLRGEIEELERRLASLRRELDETGEGGAA